MYTSNVARLLPGGSDARMGRVAINTMHRGMWFDTYDNVYSLAVALHEAYQLFSAEDVLAYFEKPWNWEREWNLWVAWGKPHDQHEPGWQEWNDAMEAPHGEEAAQRYYQELDNQRNEVR